MHIKKVFLCLAVFAFLAGCKKSSDSTTSGADEDSSASGAAASSVGGALSASSSAGAVSLIERNDVRSPLQALLMPRFAMAATACPTLVTPGSSCNNVTSAIAELTYSSCSFGSASATWSGILKVTLANGNAVTCGTFPSPTSTSIQRQFVDSSHNPSTATRTNGAGIVVTIDHNTANLKNYQGDVISANIGTGYGSQVHFTAGGARDQIVINQRIYSTGRFDHSVSGTLNVTETGSGTAKTWTIASGTVTTYYNLKKAKGTASFSNVVYDTTSCFPLSGSITTTFASTSASDAIGTALNGKTETLTFSSGGTATLVDTSGNTSTVQLTHCL